MREGDFTSAHFLGLTPTGTAGALTTGRPAAVEDCEAGRPLARRLAAGPGEDGILARSSLHGLIDALATRPPGATVLLDAATYPVGQWAARAVGAEVLTFRHRDARDAVRVAQRVRRRTVVVVTDALCGSCLRPAPLSDLAELARRRDGELVVDDTLAAGVLGHRTAASSFVGSGGAGTAAWLGVSPGGMVAVSSLAKGLSAPLAVVTGPAARVARVRRDGPTRVHAGPPTAADVGALRQALADPTLDARRSRLAAGVLQVREVLQDRGLRPLGIPFALVATEGGRRDPIELHRALTAAGVRTLATTGRCTGRPTLSLCLRADHTATELRALERALAAAVSGRAA